MKRFIYTLLLALLCCPLFAQFWVEQSSHDLGQIMWQGQTTYNFTLTNKGSKALAINQVLTSSSAAKATWSKEPVLPGASTNLKVSLTNELLGQFNKAIYVYTESTAQPLVLHLQGKVVREFEEAKKPENFSYHVGNIYLSTDNIEFDEVGRGESPQQIIDIFNAGKTVYTPELMHLPKYLSVATQPSKILPNRTGKLIVSLDSRQLDAMGLTQTSVYLSRFPGDKVGNDNELSVSAVLIPAFDSTSVIQSQLAPALKMETTTLELPPFGKRTKQSGKLILENTGKSSLVIRALQVFNPAISVDLNQKIAPGQKAKLKISVDSEFLKRSRSRLRVLMITNDPKNAKVIVNIKIKK